VVLFAALVMAAGMWTIEGTFAEGPLRDLSRDTSDEDSDAVFKSISPLESAIMPVSCLIIPSTRLYTKIPNGGNFGVGSR